MAFSKVAKIMACFGSAAIFVSSQKLQAKELVACHDCHMRRLPKVKELPIYEKKDDFIVEFDDKSVLPLLSEISAVRKMLFQYGSYVNTAQEKAVQMYETGVAHSKSTFDYLRDEENKLQRILMIALGGLTGLVLARKSGFIKKIFYTSLGTGGTFYVFYPAIGKEYALIGWNASKDQVNNVLTNYGGLDTEKIAKDVNEKVEDIKSAMKFERVLNTLNEKFYNKNKSLESDKKSEEANPNQDMYTTRSST